MARAKKAELLEEAVAAVEKAEDAVKGIDSFLLLQKHTYPGTAVTVESEVGAVGVPKKGAVYSVKIINLVTYAHAYYNKGGPQRTTRTYFTKADATQKALDIASNIVYLNFIGARLEERTEETLRQSLLGVEHVLRRRQLTVQCLAMLGRGRSREEAIKAVQAIERDFVELSKPASGLTEEYITGLKAQGRWFGP